VLVQRSLAPGEPRRKAYKPGVDKAIALRTLALQRLVA